MRRRVRKTRTTVIRVGKGRETPEWCYLGMGGLGGSWECRGMPGGKVANILGCAAWDLGWSLMGVGWSVVVCFAICQGWCLKQM